MKLEHYLWTQHISELNNALAEVRRCVVPWQYLQPTENVLRAGFEPATYGFLNFHRYSPPLYQLSYQRLIHYTGAYVKGDIEANLLRSFVVGTNTFNSLAGDYITTHRTVKPVYERTSSLW